MSSSKNQYPKLHNAAWPGVVGKGPGAEEPAIELDTMLDLTAAAKVDGVKFDGVDIFLFAPHVDIDSSDDDLRRIAEKVKSRGLVIGSVVAPVWGPTGGGSAMGDVDERKKFCEQVRKGCRIARFWREMGSTKKIIETFREACKVAEDHGERLAAEGEVCWAGMHSWKAMLAVLEGVNQPQTLGFQADMAHTLHYLLGTNAPEDRILPADCSWSDTATFTQAYKKLTAALRPWTIDFHVAQNDATVKGSGSHDKTGRHCLPTDPNGKLDITREAGFWLKEDRDQPTRKFKHICWDGCMFPNATMMKPETWNSILAAMVAVRDAHGWNA